MPRFVLDLEQHVGGRVQRGQHLGQRGCERRVQDHGPRPGVVEQVAQLLADVAVVHVERAPRGRRRSRASPRGTRCRCRGRGRGGPGPTPSSPARRALACGRPGPCRAGRSARRLERSATSRVGEAAVPPDDALAVGQALDEDVEGLGQVELDGRVCWKCEGVSGTVPHCTGALRRARPVRRDRPTTPSSAKITGWTSATPPPARS